MRRKELIREKIVGFHNRLGKFELDSMIVFVLFMVANVINYAFQVVMGRILSVEEYSVVNALLSLFNILTVPSAVLSLEISKICASLHSVENTGVAYRIISRKFIKLSAVLMLLELVLGLLVGIFLSNMWKIDNSLFVGVAIAAVSAQTIAVSRGMMQGYEMFGKYGVQNIIQCLGKLALAMALIQMGLEVWGVIIALIVSNIITTIYGIQVLDGIKKRHYDKNYCEIKTEIEKVFLKSMAMYLCVIILANGDLLITRAVLDETSAGLYASATNLARISMYVATAVATTMFPLVAKQKARGMKTYGILIKALVYGGGVAIACIVALLVLGEPLILFFFGQKYVEAFPFISVSGCYIIPVTLLTIITNYMIAAGGEKFFLTSFSVFMLPVCFLVYIFKNSATELFGGIGIVLLCLTILNMAYIWKKENMRK